MTIKVDYMSDEEIEFEADALLKSFQAKYGSILTPYIPLEEIIENHLGLAFEITDLGHPAILGQLDIQDNVIRVNTVLDPHSDPRNEGRYNYTLAHEGGHSVLHRPYVEELMETASLFNQAGNETPSNIVLCRIEDQRTPIEIQADKFASFLLLPREKVTAEFIAYTNRPFVRAKPLISTLRHNRDFLNQRFHWKHIPTDNEILHHAFKELADTFKVSMQAMVIRLKILGLIREDKQAEMILT